MAMFSGCLLVTTMVMTGVVPALQALPSAMVDIQDMVDMAGRTLTPLYGPFFNPLPSQKCPKKNILTLYELTESHDVCVHNILIIGLRAVVMYPGGLEVPE